MQGVIKKFLAAVLVMALTLSFVSCSAIFDKLISAGNPGDEGGGDDSGGVDFPGQEESVEPDEWGGVSDFSDTVHLRIMRGDTVNLMEYADGLSDIESLVWSSRCDAIATVKDGSASGVKAGKTLITASLDGEVLVSFSVTVEFMVSQNNGFNIVSDVKDSTVYEAASLYEANRILDRAIARRVNEVKIDFSPLSKDFSIQTDFDLDSEFGNHTSIRMSQIPGNPTVTFEIVYKTDAASEATPLTAENTYHSVTNANALIRRVFEAREGGVRADDFDGFAINTKNKGEMDVYNSEELWWAVEHGYKPSFPVETKAALFYERAKMILREIITDKMTDYEKVVAIYEYLVEAVSYDYDAYYLGAGKENTCYYLEGVFERGRAVCDGKTKAFVLLCGIEGIECVRGFGDSLDGGTGHAWNYVKISDRWYLVDTTEGDVKYAGGAIEQFVGKQIETVGYDALLKPVDYHNAKYVYTEMWESISDSPYYEIDYYKAPLGLSDYDFTLDSSDELLSMFGAIYEGGVSDCFIITFVPTDSDSFWDYFKSAEKKYDFEKQIFTVSYDTVKVYIAICVVK